MNRWQARSPAARSYAWCSAAFSRSRPTIGESRRRARPGAPASDAEQAVGADGLALPFQLEGLDGLHLDGVTDEVVRGLTEEDLARRRSLFEALRDVDRVAGREALAAARVARDDLAGVDPGSNPNPNSPVALELCVQLLEPRAHLPRGTHCAECVVLVQDRDTEHGHHRVADELLDRAFMDLDDRLHLVEVPAHHAAKRFGVELLAERGRARHVAEDDRHGLPDLARFLGCQGRSAGPAELESLGVLLAALLAGRHRGESKLAPLLSQRHLTDTEMMS